jgi:hypothetical protein
LLGARTWRVGMKILAALFRWTQKLLVLHSVPHSFYERFQARGPVITERRHFFSTVGMCLRTNPSGDSDIEIEFLLSGKWTKPVLLLTLLVSPSTHHRPGCSTSHSSVVQRAQQVVVWMLAIYAYSSNHGPAAIPLSGIIRLHFTPLNNAIARGRPASSSAFQALRMSI